MLTKLAIEKMVEEAKSPEGMKLLHDIVFLGNTALALYEKLERLDEFASWAQQTVHRAYHDGPLETCPKDVCASYRAYKP
jgi:hypothetical protein